MEPLLWGRKQMNKETYITTNSTTCFEGKRFFNLRRWTANHSDLSAINVDVHGVSIAGEPGAYTYTPTVIERKNYASLWRPLPYSEVRKCPNLVQNAGYENWK